MDLTLRMDEGESTRIEFTFDPSDPAPWNDLPPATSVMLRLRRWDTQALVEVEGALDGPGADGKVRSGGAFVPLDAISGRYDGELEVEAPGTGFPQVEQFALIIRARPAR